jgi:hypothetical protein
MVFVSMIFAEFAAGGLLGVVAQVAIFADTLPEKLAQVGGGRAWSKTSVLSQPVLQD